MRSDPIMAWVIRTADVVCSTRLGPASGGCECDGYAADPLRPDAAGRRRAGRRLRRRRIEDGDADSLGGFGDRVAVLPEKCDVFGHGLAHQLFGLAAGVAGGDHAREVGGVGGVPRRVVPFEDDDVPSHGCPFGRPACFRMLASVLGFKVALGLPATVTSPALVGWVKWRCDPVGRFSIQPSCSSRRTISLTFIGTRRTVRPALTAAPHRPAVLAGTDV